MGMARTHAGLGSSVLEEGHHTLKDYRLKAGLKPVKSWTTESRRGAAEAV
jgi:hypothetical protein